MVFTQTRERFSSFTVVISTVVQGVSTVVQGCPIREEVLAHGVKASTLFAKTQERINKLRRAGYVVEEKWNCQVGN